MVSRRDRDKKGTARTGNWHALGDDLAAIEQVLLTVLALWRTRFDVDLRELATQRAIPQIESLPSPGARDDFEALCAAGCQRVVLAGLIALVRHEPAISRGWTTALAPITVDRKPTRALAKAASTFEAMVDSLVRATGATGSPEQLQATEFAVDAMFIAFKRMSPRLLASELRQYDAAFSRAVLLPRDTRSKSLSEVSKYLLSAYVRGMTGKHRDRNVSGLVASARDDPEYNEIAHRQWRYRHHQLEERFAAELQLPAFLVAASRVMELPT